VSDADATLLVPALTPRRSTAPAPGA